MTTNAPKIEVQRKVRVKAIALPTEHGSWGFLFEPLVAATAVAFSAAAPWIFLLVVGAFLMRQPLKIYLADLVAERRLPQTEVALKFVLGFSAIFFTGLAGALYFADIGSFLPFLLVSPLAAYQIYSDAYRKSRNMIPELTGAVAISSSAAVIALAGGWSAGAAFALWGVFIGRLIPTILYVRNRLKIEKGKPYSIAGPVAAHAAAAVSVAGLAWYGLSSWIVAGFFGFLLIRAAHGLSPYRRRRKAMQIGVFEVVYGVLTAAAVIAGFYSGI